MDHAPENNDAVTAAAEAKIIRKRDELLAERALLIQQREELSIRLRRADRALADCRAAARFFDLKIDSQRMNLNRPSISNPNAFNAHALSILQNASVNPYFVRI
jgi:hypothetical protein